jgi:hypothetical protein
MAVFCEYNIQHKGLLIVIALEQNESVRRETDGHNLSHTKAGIFLQDISPDPTAADNRHPAAEQSQLFPRCDHFSVTLVKCRHDTNVGMQISFA